MPSRLLIALCLIAALPLAFLACGGDDDDDDGGSAPTQPSNASETPGAEPTEVSGTIGGPEVTIDDPVSRYALSLEDFPANTYRTDIEQTLHLTPEVYAATTMFASPEDGLSKLQSWGYLDGYETAFIPEGERSDVLLTGSYFINIEVHRFESADGATEFFAHAESRLEQASQKLGPEPLAAQASGYGKIGEKIGESDIDSAYYWYLFRRGNMVAFVRTWGARELININTARALAVMVDEKALGEREAVEPTPVASGEGQ